MHVMGLETRRVCGYGLDGYGYRLRLRYPFETHTRAVGMEGFLLQSLSTPLHVHCTQQAACHVPTSPTLSPNSSPLVICSSPAPSPDPSPVIPYTTPACPVTCYACHSRVMCTTMGSAQLFANSSSNRSHVCETSPPHDCRHPFWCHP